MQIKRPSKLYLFIAYFLALAPQKHEPKKGTNICQCQSAAKYAKQLWLTPTHTPTHTQREAHCCWHCRTHTATHLHEGHDDNCAESTFYWPHTAHKVENQKKNCSTTLKDNKCCRQIQILSTTLAVCCSIRTLFPFNSYPVILLLRHFMLL